LAVRRQIPFPDHMMFDTVASRKPATSLPLRRAGS
jgi:hypothetical protein